MQPRLSPWIALVAGWLAGTAVLARWGEGLVRAECVSTCAVDALPGTNGPPGPRHLRAVPGVGRKRSLDLARALWDAGLEPWDAPALERVHGIGPVTASAVARAFSAFAPSRGPGAQAVHSPFLSCPSPDRSNLPTVSPPGRPTARPPP
jgi:hypothetical protein